MSLIIKNIDTVNVVLDDLGITLAPSEVYDLAQDRPNTIATSSDLPATVVAGQVAVLDPLDGITPLSISRAQEAIGVMNNPNYRIHGGDLNQLEDVTTTSPADDNVLIYSSGQWVNVPASQIVVPAPPLTSVQFNTANAFDGSADFTYDDANSRLTIQGPVATTRAIVHSGTDALDATQLNASAYYIQVDGDGVFDALRAKFQRSTAGISGYAAYNYDGATPNIRLTDEDDDSPYISFHTIASGTYAAPEFISSFGARGARGVRDPGQDVNGFAWVIGSATDPSVLWNTGNYDPAMELDQHWLRIPTGTTAEQPITPVNGMVRYDTTTNKAEGYENGSWKNVWPHRFYAHNSTATQTLTATFVTMLVGTVAGSEVRSDSIYTNANGEVTVNRTGWYKVTYDFTTDTTNNRSTGEAVLQVDGTDVPGSFCYTYSRNTTNGEDTGSASVLVQVTAGQVIRVRIREVAGSIVTKANSCRLIIEQAE